MMLRAPLRNSLIPKPSAEPAREPPKVLRTSVLLVFRLG